MKIKRRWYLQGIGPKSTNAHLKIGLHGINFNQVLVVIAEDITSGQCQELEKEANKYIDMNPDVRAHVFTEGHTELKEVCLD